MKVERIIERDRRMYIYKEKNEQSVRREMMVNKNRREYKGDNKKNLNRMFLSPLSIG